MGEKSRAKAEKDFFAEVAKLGPPDSFQERLEAEVWRDLEEEKRAQMSDEQRAKYDAETVQRRTNLAVQVLSKIAGLDRDPNKQTVVFSMHRPKIDWTNDSFMPGELTGIWPKQVEKMQKALRPYGKTLLGKVGLKVLDALQTEKSYMINIQPANLYDGSSYFAEASHLVRHFAKKDTLQESASDKLKSGEDVPVIGELQIGEFYDKAGQMIGRALAREEDRKLKKLLGDRLYSEARAEFQYLFLDQPEKFRLETPEERNREAEGLRERRKLLHEVILIGRALKNNITHDKEKLKSNPAPELKKRIDAQTAKYAEIADTVRGEKINLLSYLTHRKPYGVAEGYNADTFLSTPDFYRLTDAQVREKFFRGGERGVQVGAQRDREAKGKLEQTAEVGLFLILPVFLVYLFFNLSSVTGFSINEVLANGFIRKAGLLGILVILILIGVKIYLRNKRAKRKV